MAAPTNHWKLGLFDQMNAILGRIDGLLREIKDKEVPEQVVAALDNMNGILGEVRRKLDQVEAGKLAQQVQKTLGGLDETVTRMNQVLARVDGDGGLVSSVTRTSDAFADTAQTAGGLGSRVEDTLKAVEEAARSIHKLADALERDPDMLVKGRAERNR